MTITKQNSRILLFLLQKEILYIIYIALFFFSFFFFFCIYVQAWDIILPDLQEATYSWGKHTVVIILKTK